MPETAPRVLAVNVLYKIRRGPTRETAIDKRSVPGPVAVGELGLAGDRQCDSRYHGGPDRAVYAYAAEDALWWESQLGREITPGLFGENLTTIGLDVSSSLIGEQWQIGDPGAGPLLEVRLPRTPCGNLSARLQIPRFHTRFAASGRVGAYLKVLQPGLVCTGDPITVSSQPGHGVTIATWCLQRTPDQARRLLDAGIDLAEPLHRSAMRTTKQAR